VYLVVTATVLLTNSVCVGNDPKKQLQALNMPSLTGGHFFALSLFSMAGEGVTAGITAFGTRLPDGVIRVLESNLVEQLLTLLAEGVVVLKNLC
jgi:hypothetical protein